MLENLEETQENLEKAKQDIKYLESEKQIHLLEIEKASELIIEMDEEITTKTQLIEDFKVSYEIELDKNKRLTSLINERMITDMIREQASFSAEENDVMRMPFEETDNLSKILSSENKQRSFTLPKTGTGDTPTNSKPLVNVGK